MNVLVTGASGFIGNALVQRLVCEGYNVRALMHQKPPASLHCNVHYIVGDVTDSSSLPALVHDVDVVFHCAALVRDFGSTKEILEVNLQGTKNLVEVCGPNIQRFIFLSHLHSPSTIKAGAYSRAKALAEQYLLMKYEQEKFPAVIIRPGNVYGPGATVWVVRLLQTIQQNKIVLIDKGKGIFLHTYIGNLIDGLIASMTAPPAVGEIIDITDGDNHTTWGQYLTSLASMAGLPSIQQNLSKRTAKVLSKLMILDYRLFHIEPLVTPLAVEVFTNQRTVDLKKAQTLLGYTPRIDFSKGLAVVKQWLKTEGYIT